MILGPTKWDLYPLESLRPFIALGILGSAKWALDRLNLLGLHLGVQKPYGIAWALQILEVLRDPGSHTWDLHPPELLRPQSDRDLCVPQSATVTRWWFFGLVVAWALLLLVCGCVHVCGCVCVCSLCQG